MKDLPKFKEGDRVWHLPTGEWYTLEKNGFNRDYPLQIELPDMVFETLTIDGKLHEGDVNPVIFHTEQTLNFEKPKFIPEEGELCYFWDDDTIKAAIVRRFKEHIEDVIYGYKADNDALYRFCCPITEIPPYLL